MKYIKIYKRIIATKEMAAGNESVGSMWNETKTFSPETPIKDIVEWAYDCHGKLIITIDESEADDNIQLNF